MLFPVLGFVNIYFMRYSLVADHWQYSAMLGIVALFVGGIYRIMERRGIIRQGGFVAVPVIITLVFLSWNQQRIYKDEETLWRSTLAKNPNAWSAHVNLGIALAKKGKIQKLYRITKPQSASVQPAQKHTILLPLPLFKKDSMTKRWNIYRKPLV